MKVSQNHKVNMDKQVKKKVSLRDNDGYSDHLVCTSKENIVHAARQWLNILLIDVNGRHKTSSREKNCEVEFYDNHRSGKEYYG